MRHDQLGDVAPIDASLRESEWAGLVPVCILIMLGEPAAEMQGIVGEGAHIGGAHIEQMAGLCRRIGHAAADRLALLDQRNADRVICIAQQMAGEQHSARAAANNDNVRAVSRRHGHSLRPQ